MPSYTSPLQSESELQYDPDSSPNFTVNCGPSSIEKIGNFYKDLATFGIEKTRDLGTNRNGTGTNLTEQKRMLERRGIPSEALQLTPAQIHDKLKSGRRPIVLWLHMKYIPQSVKGSTFDGRHAVTALANGVVNGEKGIWVNEPNQHRERAGYKKSRFYPDKFWVPASSAIDRWAVVPTKDKAIATRQKLEQAWVVVKSGGLNVRSGPSSAKSIVGVLPEGAKFTSNLIERNGGSYRGPDGEITRSWLGYIRSGKQVWVARAFCNMVKE